MHALEKEMAAHSNILAWRIPGMEEPGGLLVESVRSHRVRRNWSNLAAAAAAWGAQTPGSLGPAMFCQGWCWDSEHSGTGQTYTSLKRLENPRVPEIFTGKWRKNLVMGGGRADVNKGPRGMQ